MRIPRQPIRIWILETIGALCMIATPLMLWFIAEAGWAKAIIDQ